MTFVVEFAGIYIEVTNYVSTITKKSSQERPVPAE